MRGGGVGVEDDTTTGAWVCILGGPGEVEVRVLRSTASPAAFLIVIALLLGRAGSWKLELLGAGLLDAWLGVCAIFAADILGVCG